VKNLLKEFREFAFKSNVIDLAVAVVIGVAFNAVVTSLVNDVIMPIVAAIIGKPNFNDLVITLGGTPVYYGRFLTALLNFLIIAATLFVIIRSFEQMQKRALRRGDVDEEDVKPDDVVLLTEIRDLLAEGRAEGSPAPSP
jgi:large conductance mechanosensitive channel